MPTLLPLLSLALPLVLALPFTLGCQGDRLSPPAFVAESELYWALTLDHHAVTLSMPTTPPYDTLTVTATPRNMRGEPLTGLPAPTYVSADVEQVLVTAAGVVVAAQPTPRPVAIVATLTTNNLKHSDTLWVKVVDEAAPPVLASLSIQPISPDSAKWGALGAKGAQGLSGTFGLKPLVARAFDTGGAPIPDLLVDYRSSDPTTARIDFENKLIGVRPGRMTLYASATAFGVSKADTLPFRIGWPLVREIELSSTAPAVGSSANVFTPSEIKVGTGGLVFFTNLSDMVADVTFADGSLPTIAAGNTFSEFANPAMGQVGFSWQLLCVFIPTLECGTGGNAVIPATFVPQVSTASSALRVFSAPGTYEYQSTTHGVSGRITVVDER